MTVESISTEIEYTANGVTTVFSYPYRVLTVNDVAVLQNGAPTPMGYTPTLVDGGNGGLLITFNFAPASGQIIKLMLAIPQTQEVVYIENDPFPAKVQESALDKLTLLIQQIGQLIFNNFRRTLRVPLGETVNELPAAATRANKYVAMDATGQPLMTTLSVANPGTGAIVASIGALKALSVSGLASGAECLVLSYYGIGGSSSQFGGGVFRYNSASVVAEDGGTIFQPNVGSGRWERMYDGDMYNTWFGTVGDGATDDTAAWQKALDVALANGRTLRGVKGNYLVAPLYANGSAWAAGGKVVVPGVELACVRALIGEGRMGFGTRFIAKPGSYPNATDAILTAVQIVNRRFEGLAFDGGTTVAKRLFYSDWTGPDTANGNTFRDLWGENCAGTPGVDGLAFSLDGAADGEIANLQYRGGTPDISFSIILAGGAIHAHDIYAYRGAIELTCQNMTITNSFIANGIRMRTTSQNFLNLVGFQISQDPSTGITFNSLVSGVGTTGSVNFLNGLFLKGASFASHFAGRFMLGGKVTNCHFVDDGYFGTIVPTGSALPVFDFQFCAVDGGGAFPASVPGQVDVALYQFRNGAAILEAQRRYPGALRLGDAEIEKDTLEANTGGLRLRSQALGTLTADTFIGLLYNRSNLSGETELVIRDGASTTPLWRLTAWDGAIASILLTMNAAAGEGFYPTPTNTWKNGRAGNLWSEIFAGNATINTSDADMKTELLPFTAAELAAARDIAREFSMFQMKDAIERKGQDAARWHVGTTVQRVEEIMKSHDLDPWRYSFMCKDADEDGNVHLGIRHEHLLMFIARGQEERLAALEAR
jgi:hypothetical protein